MFIRILRSVLKYTYLNKITNEKYRVDPKNILSATNYYFAI